MADEELRLADALGYVCVARAQTVLAANALFAQDYVGLASALAPALVALEGVQEGIMDQIAQHLRRTEEGS